MNIDNLMNDLLVVIFKEDKKCTPLSKISFVCKRWKEICDQEFGLYAFHAAGNMKFGLEKHFYFGGSLEGTFINGQVMIQGKSVIEIVESREYLKTTFEKLLVKEKRILPSFEELPPYLLALEEKPSLWNRVSSWVGSFFYHKTDVPVPVEPVPQSPTVVEKVAEPIPEPTPLIEKVAEPIKSAKPIKLFTIKEGRIFVEENFKGFIRFCRTH